MPRVSFIITGVVLALVFLVLFCFPGDPGPGREEPRRPVTLALNASDAASVPEPTSVVREVPRAAPEAAETTPPEQATRDTIRITGRIRVADRDGVEHLHEDGSFVVLSWPHDERQETAVEIRSGQFAADLPAVSSVRVEQIVLGRRHAAMQERWQDLEVAPGGFLDLSAHWLEDVVLRVIAADTGIELDELQVLRLTEWPRDDFEHPSTPREGEVLLASAASPIRLTLDHSEGGYERWVCCLRRPGYAWNRVEVDPFVGGEELVVLQPAGSLCVTVVAPQRSPYTMLRLRRCEDDCEDAILNDCLGERDQVEIESVAIGSYLVNGELGYWWDEPRVLGSVPVTIAAGVQSFVTLELAPPPSFRKVPLTGTVLFPRAWGVDEFILYLRYLDEPLDGGDDHVVLSSNDMEQVPGAPETFRWDFGSVQPGRYLIGSAQADHEELVEVGDNGRTDVRLVLPAPARVSLRVVDQGTGRDAEPLELTWRPAPAVETGSYCADCVTRDDVTLRYEFSAPQGRILVDFGDWTCPVELMVGPGSNSFTLEHQPNVPRVWRPPWFGEVGGGD